MTNLNAPSAMQAQGFPLYAVDTTNQDQTYLVVGWSLGSTVALPVLVPLGGLAMNSAFTGKPETQWIFTMEMPVKVEKEKKKDPLDKDNFRPALRSVTRNATPRYGA